MIKSKEHQLRLWPLFAVVLLPVAVLAVVGLLLLRQDRRATQAAAAERAQGISEWLAAGLWAEMTNSGSMVQLEVQTNGTLLKPAPSEPAPTPPVFDVSRLSSAQRSQWERLNLAQVNDPPPRVIELCGTFLATGPPPEFASIASYWEGLAQMELQDPLGANNSFAKLLDEYNESLGVTGLPLAPLANYQLLKIQLSSWQEAAGTMRNPIGADQVEDRAEASRFDDVVARQLRMHQRLVAMEGSLTRLGSNLIARPNALSGYLLEQLQKMELPGDLQNRAREWRRVWLLDEAVREWHRTVVQPALGESSMDQWHQGVWVSEGPRMASVAAQDTNHLRLEYVQEGPWLIVGEQRGELVSISAFAQSEMVQAARSIVDSSRHIPEYFGVSVDVAGRSLPSFGEGLTFWREELQMTRSGGQIRRQYVEGTSAQALAWATSPGGLVRVKVFLASPETLHRMTRARLFWMSCLIGLSACAAFAGAWAVQRSYAKQVRLHELKSNFVASVSHELRAPTGTILLLAENLERGKVGDAEQHKEYYTLILKEGRRLASLIENLLDFSRIEQGRKEYRQEDTDLRALVNETIKVIQPRARECDVRIDSKLPTAHESGMIAFVDGRAVQQALVNLLDNAIKHSAPGSAVTVALEEDASDVRLWVEDSGPGIAKEEQQRIFETFYRCGSELRRETAGVGIGLSIVKHIVESHNGRVEVRSAPGEGSRFTLVFPKSSKA